MRLRTELLFMWRPHSVFSRSLATVFLCGISFVNERLEADDALATMSIASGGDTVRLQGQWLRLAEDTAPWMGGGWTVYERDDAGKMLRGLNSARVAEPDPVGSFSSSGGRPVVLTLPASRKERLEPDSVTISVGGVPQEFTSQRVGVAVELFPEVRSAESVTFRTVVKRIRFIGFKEYTGATTQEETKPKVKTPSGFYQPIFETDTRELRVTLKSTQRAILNVNWPAVTDADRAKWEVEPSIASVSAFSEPSDAAALLVVGME